MKFFALYIFYIFTVTHEINFVKEHFFTIIRYLGEEAMIVESVLRLTFNMTFATLGSIFTMLLLHQKESQ